MRMRMCWYTFRQILGILYSDENKRIRSAACEYCNESLSMFDKIIFPRNCVNYKANINNRFNTSMEDSKLRDLDESGAVNRDKSESFQDNSLFNIKKTSRLRQNWDRPHFYHVICQDLIQEKLGLPQI